MRQTWHKPRWGFHLFWPELWDANAFWVASAATLLLSFDPHQPMLWILSEIDTKQVHDTANFFIAPQIRLHQFMKCCSSFGYLWRSRKFSPWQNRYVTTMKNKHKALLQIYKVASNGLIGLNKNKKLKLTRTTVRIRLILVRVVGMAARNWKFPLTSAQ